MKFIDDYIARSAGKASNMLIRCSSRFAQNLRNMVYQSRSAPRMCLQLLLAKPTSGVMGGTVKRWPRTRRFVKGCGVNGNRRSHRQRGLRFILAEYGFNKSHSGLR